MTKTEIALAAIRGLTPSRMTHVDVLSVCRALALTTDEATELRKMVGRAWVATAPGDLRDVLHVAKEATNRYARDMRFR